MHTESTPEVWLFVKGWPGYEVSNHGRVRSWCQPRGWRKEPRILTGGTDKDGYHKLILCRDGIRRHVRRAALVAEVFIGPRPAGLVVCHENNSRTDDRPENLRYDTQLSNIADQFRHGTRVRGGNGSRALLTESQAREALTSGEPAKAIAARLGVSPMTVYAIRARRIWRHLGAP